MELSDICEKISTTNLKTNLKTELYTNASDIINSFQNGDVLADFPLTEQAVTNIQTDLTARDDDLKVSASHLFLSLVHLSKHPPLSEPPNCWTVPINSFVSDTKLLVKTCFPLLGSTNLISQQKSLSVVMQQIEEIKSWSVQSNKEAQVLLTHMVENCVLSRLEEMLGDPERQEVLAMQIWQQLIHSIGNYIPKTNHELINRLLKLIEFCFKNTREEVQICAYTSWSILIKTFSLHPTYLVKKLRLFNVPLLSCAVKQEHRYALVDVERAKTWCQLMLSLMPELQDHANTVCTPLFLFCIGLDPKLTLFRKFNETFTTHFSSLNANKDSTSLQVPIPIQFAQDPEQTVSTLLASIDTDTNFMTLLSSLSNTQHLPKKAILDPDTLYDWRKQLCYQGITSLAAFLDIKQPSTDTNTDLDARNIWIVDNYRVLLALIGLSVHLFDPIDGDILSECFDKVIQVMTSCKDVIDPTDLLYPCLAISRIAVVRSHMGHVVVGLVQSVYDSIPEILSLPISASSSSTNALLFIEILLEPHVLNSEDLPESFFHLYQQLLLCRNIESRDLRDYQHLLAKLDTINDVITLCRCWKITAEALLLVLQTYNRVNEVEHSNPDSSTCKLTLSFVFTRINEAPDSLHLVKECACVWKKLASNVLKLISEVSLEESNNFINSLSQTIDSITESQLNSSNYLYFVSLLLDELVSLIDLKGTVVYSQGDMITSPLKSLVNQHDNCNKLGNISYSVCALSKLLNFVYFSQIPDLPTDSTDNNNTITIEHIANSESISNLIITSTYLFSHLDDPLLIQNVLAYLSAPLGLYFELTYVSSVNTADTSSQVEQFTALLQSLWNAIRSSILANFESSYNTEFLLILCPILLPLFNSTDVSFISSASDFFSKTFANCTDDTNFPDSLKTILATLQTQSLRESTLSSNIESVPTPVFGETRKSQGVRKMEERDEDSPESKRIKLSDNELTLPNSNNEIFSDDFPHLDSDQIETITINETQVDLTNTDVSHPVSSCEEDPLPSCTVITLSDDDISDVIAITPNKPVPEPSNNNSARPNKITIKFNSEQKTKLKQTKLSKTTDVDKSKSKGSWPQSPNEKEKKAFFKLELTPIKLEEFPKSSPTHNTVNRKLQFSPDSCEKESVSLPQNSQEVEIIDLDMEPVHDSVMTSSDAPANNQANLHLDLDSIDEFIRDIPLSDIISPDELNAINLAETALIADDATVSEATSSLISLSSSSVSQSVTPPASVIEIPPQIAEDADSILAFNDCIKTEHDSLPINLDNPDVEQMEVDEDTTETEEQVINLSIDSVATQDDVLNTSGAVNDCSPEVTTANQSLNQFETPKQSILKKTSTFSPSPTCKKVSFANPIQETHAIATSPRTRKLRTQKQSPTSKLTSATTSIGARRATRIGMTGALTSNPDDPIYSALLECTEPVDALVPFLTSQSVSRGITGLLKAKKIETIGDLAMLNEREAEALPIQPPKLLTLRTAFSKYQVTQFGIPGDLTRQSNNPLFFPLTQTEEQGTGEEDQMGIEEDQVVPVHVTDPQDAELKTNADSIAIDIPEYPIEEIDISPDLTSTSVQTDPVPSDTLVNELSDTLPRELEVLSKEQLTNILNSLCQLIPPIADQFKAK